MGKKSAAALLRNIEASQAKNPLPRVLNGAGHSVRRRAHRADSLAETFGSLDAIAEADLETLQKRRRGRPEGRAEHPPVLRRTP